MACPKSYIHGMEHTMRAMMSDRESRACGIMYAKTITGLMEEAAVAALDEAASILAATEPEDALDGLGDSILGWPYQDTPPDLRVRLADALSAFLSAPNPANYLAAVA